MKIIGLRGLRGGVGTTSIVAGLAWASAQQGARVLVVDLCQDNQLRLHLGCSYEDSSGWSKLSAPARQWQHEVLNCALDIALLPHGGNRVSSDLDWLKQLFGYDLILLDMPPGLAISWLNQQLTVIHADANCHVRLYCHQLLPNEHLLLTQFSSQRTLQQDLLDLWLQAGLPILNSKLHRDECMSCALAAKQPVGAFAPESMISHELNEIANWCLQGKLTP